jgi:hypothetical protein
MKGSSPCLLYVVRRFLASTALAVLDGCHELRAMARTLRGKVLAREVRGFK